MSIDSTLVAALDQFKASGRIVIVGASLAGQRAAETLRAKGFQGHLTIIGDEPYEAYDRPPLSKQVLLGTVPADHTTLPRRPKIEADWRLGVAATGLDRAAKQVLLANGEQVRYDLLLIATGVRARPWFNPAEAALDGVFSIRTRVDAAGLRERLAAGPRRVLIVGAGFIGSEVASICRELGLDVTVAERGEGPLVGALGGVIGRIAAEMQRDHGVDLRTGVSVTSFAGDANGRLRSATLSDGSTLDVDVAVVALGSMRNVEWLEGSGLAAGAFGVGCDAGARAVDINGVSTDSIFVVGDVARAPHALYEYQFLAMEHWDNAVLGAEVAAHNMVCLESDRRPHLLMPGFWSGQFGVNIKSVGVPPFGDEIVFTQGSVEDRCFVAAYGRRGRIVAAVSFDQGKWLEHYGRLIEQSAPFPPPAPGYDLPDDMTPIPAEFPDPGAPTALPEVVLTGHDPSERQVAFRPRTR
jgi:NADPH-dependent 2,4-dienoyl-CoA reductase/sulfur reductase-like enzyme